MCEQALTTEEEVLIALLNGARVFAEWKQEGSPYKTAPGEVRAVKDGMVLVDHWSSRWYRVNDPCFKLVAHYLEQ